MAEPQTAASKPVQKAAPETYKKMPEGFRHIVRVANVDLPGDKQIRFALTKIKGIGINFADSICIISGINKTSKTGYLTPEQIAKLITVTSNPAQSGLPAWMFNRRKDYETSEDKHLLTGTLSFYQDNDIKTMKKIKSYKGVRHIQNLPVRGQRTRSNFRKMKGKVVGVVKKKIAPGAGDKEKGGKEKGGKDKK